MNLYTYDENNNHVQIINNDFEEYSNSIGENSENLLNENKIDFDAV